MSGQNVASWRLSDRSALKMGRRDHEIAHLATGSWPGARPIDRESGTVDDVRRDRPVLILPTQRRTELLDLLATPTTLRAEPRASTERGSEAMTDSDQPTGVLRAPWYREPRFWLWDGAVQVGWIGLIIGVIFIAVHTQLWSDFSAIIRDFGVGLFIFGLITLTFEGTTRRELASFIRREIDTTHASLQTTVSDHITTAFDALKASRRELTEDLSRQIDDVAMMAQATARDSAGTIVNTSLHAMMKGSLGIAYETVQEMMRKRTFLRPDMEFRLWISPIHDRDDCVLVEYALRYDVVNDAADTSTFIFELSEDVIEVEGVDVTPCFTNVEWNGEPLPTATEFKNGAISVRYEKEMEPNATAKAYLAWQSVRHISDHSDLAMSYVTQKLWVEVSYPESLNVFVRAAGADSALLQDRGWIQKARRWAVTDTLLPHQGIVVAWTPSEE